jgi:hypothetical protein
MSAALTQSPAAESHRLVAFATLMVCFIQSATISLPNAALLCGFRRSQPSIPTETSHLFRRSQPDIPTEASRGGGMV